MRRGLSRAGARVPHNWCRMVKYVPENVPALAPSARRDTEPLPSHPGALRLHLSDALVRNIAEGNDAALHERVCDGNAPDDPTENLPNAPHSVRRGWEQGPWGGGRWIRGSHEESGRRGVDGDHIGGVPAIAVQRATERAARAAKRIRMLRRDGKCGRAFASTLLRAIHGSRFGHGAAQPVRERLVIFLLIAHAERERAPSHLGLPRVHLHRRAHLRGLHGTGSISKVSATDSMDAAKMSRMSEGLTANIKRCAQRALWLFRSESPWRMFQPRNIGKMLGGGGGKRTARPDARGSGLGHGEGSGGTRQHRGRETDHSPARGHKHPPWMKSLPKK
jgi:hypothetical protein